MTDPTKPPNAAQKNAQKYFAKAERAEKSEMLAKQTLNKERTVGAAKTAKLRGLRLAKEAADKEEVEKQAVEKSESRAQLDDVHPTRRKRAATVKAVKMRRMSY